MNKYIDAEKLKSEIKLRREKLCERYLDVSEDANLEYDVLSEILNIIESHQQEQQEVDLDALVNEAFDKYSSVDGYGQLVASFNRDELYQFIKRMALVFNTKKEE